MIKQETNRINLVGTVTDVKVEPKISKNGKDFVSGSITVDVNDSAYEAHFFSMKLKKDGTVSSQYNSYLTLDKMIGKRVRVTGSFDQTEVPANGALQKGTRLKASFINVLNDSSVEDGATFSISGFISEGLKAVYESDGATIKDYVITIAQPSYDLSYLQLFRLNVNPKNTQAVEAIDTRFTVGTTCSFEGVIDYKIQNNQVEIANDFGPATTRSFQNSVKRYEIISGLLSDNEYTQEEITDLMNKTQARDTEQLKLRAAVPASTQAAGFSKATITPRLI